MSEPTARIEARAGQDSSGAFSIRLVIGLVVVGVLSFAAFIVLSAFADDLRKPDDVGEHALSKSAVGYAALVEMLQGDGLRVRVSRGQLQELQGSEQLVVLTPRAGQKLKMEQLYSNSGDVLIILPKWNTWPDSNKQGWVYSDGLTDARYIERIFEDLFGANDTRISIGHAPGAKEVLLNYRGGFETVPTGRIERLQTISSSRIEPIVTDPDGHTVFGRLRSEFGAPAPYEEDVLDGEAVDDPLAEPELAPGDPIPEAGPEEPPEAPVAEEQPWTPGQGGPMRSVYILSEPDLLNTKGLASLQTARAGLWTIRLLAGNSGEVVFDMSLHGMERSRNFMKLLLEPPFLPAVLCLLFAGMLMAYYSAAGRVRMKSGREIALGKATLVENTALLLSLAGRDARMGRRYVAMTRALAAVAAGVPTRAPEDQQTRLLDAVGRAEGEAKYSELAADVASAATPSNMLKAANRLFRWRQEIGRERRGR